MKRQTTPRVLTKCILQELKTFSDPEKAAFYPHFFQTGPGQYAEGDLFLGVTVPNIRQIAKKFWKESDPDTLSRALRDPYHEMRLCALIMLVEKYQKEKNKNAKEAYVQFYLSHLDHVDNWDLVDTSAPGILGHWLLDKDKSLLYSLATSGHLWKERISIISTLHFIRKGHMDDTFRIAEILLSHPHHLIHKATGWMLREVAKRDYENCYSFLKDHYKTMPRMMLRYAIERFDEPVRKGFLSGLI